MKIDIIGCMHGEYPELEGGDLLIITGDLTISDTWEQHIQFNQWLNQQNYIKKIVIAGNHDNFLQKCLGNPYLYSTYAEYLCDSGTEFAGLKIWGTPWSLKFRGLNPHCAAFTGEEEELKGHYDKIPLDTDILISHSPMHGLLDKVQKFERVNTFIKGEAFTMRKPIKNEYENCGSKTLREKVESLPNIKLFCCSHIHEGYGQALFKEMLSEKQDVICVNASIMNENYEAVNKPIRIEL